MPDLRPVGDDDNVHSELKQVARATRERTPLVPPGVDGDRYGARLHSFVDGYLRESFNDDPYDDRTVPIFPQVGRHRQQFSVAEPDEKHWWHEDGGMNPYDSLDLSKPTTVHQYRIAPARVHQYAFPEEHNDDVFEDFGGMEVPTDPLAVREDGTQHLLDGHHRLSANTLMGRQFLPAIVQENTFDENGELANPACGDCDPY